jgi:hypothetical protein
MTALIGKYFLGFQDGFAVTGVVEASVNDAAHYLVRIEGFEDEPEHFAVAAVAHMVGSAGYDDEQGAWAWVFFDTAEQRAKYQAWLTEMPPDRRPRVVPLRKDD